MLKNGDVVVTYTQEIKKELSECVLSVGQAKSQLKSLMENRTEVKGKGLEVRCESLLVADRISQLFAYAYNTGVEISVHKRVNLRKNNVYVIRISVNILDDLRLLETDGSSFLAGAFMAYGSCNSPDSSSSHLEIASSSSRYISTIYSFMKNQGFDCKIIKRSNRYVAYIKKHEDIIAFLKFVKAYRSADTYLETKQKLSESCKEIRKDNCAKANQKKTDSVSERQIELIEVIEDYEYQDKLDKRTRMVFELRKKYQRSSLTQLCKEYAKEYGESISKSGMKHRLDKLEDVALSLGGYYEQSKS